MKSKDRVNKNYREGTKDWEDQYNMLLDDGVTCGDCKHSERCKAIFGGNDSNTRCQFYPNRFIAKIMKCDLCGKELQPLDAHMGKIKGKLITAHIDCWNSKIEKV